jgi:hypothetical protein
MLPLRFLAGLSVLATLLTAGPTTALAFCGFFVAGSKEQLSNNASHVALLRRGTHTVLSMSNNYKGPPEDFALVVPVPVVLKKQQVKTLKPQIFERIDALTAPRLVEYWEQDPCNPYTNVSRASPKAAMKKADGDDFGGAESAARHGVKIEAQFVVGEYEILILTAQDSSGLETWLRLQKYNIPQGASAALAPYIAEQQKFFVAKVDIKKVHRDSHGLVVLSPLQFSYESKDLRLPVRLGLLNAPSGQDAAAKQDLIVYILHKEKRFEAANYPNVFIPTNLEVVEGVREHYGAFYAELFDETLRRQNNRAVVTEYSWDSASCDPCPTPPLEPSEIHTLGASREASEESWVVTRLHTRYDKQTLNEDLVFRAARPALGGRAEREDFGGPVKASVRSDETNNFQGRYILRNYWTAAPKCRGGQHGVWGGPPGRRGSHGPKTSPAQDLANAARGQVQLAQVVKSKVPPLGLPGLTRTGAPLPTPPPTDAPKSPPPAPKAAGGK